MRRGEQGSALLAVLILVAMIGALAAIGVERFRAAVRLGTQAAALDQARALALSAEQLAAQRIEALNGRATARTTLGGNWNGVPRRIVLPDGSAVVTVRDGGNCFNLNSVVSGDAQSGFVQRPEGIAQFVALLRLLGVRERTARGIAAALGDWIDSDGDGIEDRAYDGYRTANRLVADVAELRAVAGVDGALYARLRPWICALPEAELSPVNANTLLTGQWPLLQMILPAGDARALLAARPAQGWGSSGEFWAQAGLVAPTGGQPGVVTRWFALELEVEIAGHRLHERAVIDAGRSPARTVWRSWRETEG